MNSDQHSSAMGPFSASRVFMVTLFACIGISLFLWAYNDHTSLNESTSKYASGTYPSDKSEDVNDPAELAKQQFRSRIGPIIFRYVMAILFVVMAIGIMIAKTEQKQTVDGHD